MVIASRKLAACEALAARIAECGGQAHPLAAMSVDWESLAAVVDAAASRWGRLDGLVNNAGMSPLAPSLLETSETLFDKVIGVNLKGPTRLTALAATAMARTGGGSILNISSLASVSRPRHHGLRRRQGWPERVDHSYRIEYAGSGVRVNGIICGTFDTDAASGFVRNPALLPESWTDRAGPRGRPDESSAR